MKTSTRNTCAIKKGKVSALFLRLTKTSMLTICALLLIASLVTPLYAQLTPARDLTGKWQSSATGMYYEMDPSDPTTRMDDVTAKFAMDITQQGSQIRIILYLNPISWTTDSAYWNEYGFGGVPPVGGGAIEFMGTVSSSSFTADEQYTQFRPCKNVGFCYDLAERFCIWRFFLSSLFLFSQPFLRLNRCD